MIHEMNTVELPNAVNLHTNAVDRHMNAVNLRIHAMELPSPKPETIIE